MLDLSKIGAGGDVAAILGLNPWLTAWDVWHRITQRIDRVIETDRMRWGSRDEKTTFEGWRDDFGFSDRNWKHGASRTGFDLWPWLRVSSDFESVETGEICEVKHSGERNLSRWKVPGGMKPPDQYEVQAQVQMHALDFDVCYFAVRFGGNDCYSIETRRNVDLGNIIFDAVGEFFREYIETEKAPPIDGSTACREFLSRSGPEKKDCRAATEHETAIVLKYKQLGEEIRSLSEERDALNNEIIAALGPDEYGIKGEFGRIVAPFSEGRTSTRWRDVVEALREHVGDELTQKTIKANSKLGAARRTLKGVWA